MSQPTLPRFLAALGGATGLPRPLRVYFDTAHLQDLQHARTQRVRDFWEAVNTGCVLPVLSFVHVLEIANKRSLATRRQISDAMAPLVTGHRFAWILSGTDLTRREMAALATHRRARRLSETDVFSDLSPTVGPPIAFDVSSFAAFVEGVRIAVPADHFRKTETIASVMKQRRAELASASSRREFSSARARAMRVIQRARMAKGDGKLPIGRIELNIEDAPAMRIREAYFEGCLLSNAKLKANDMEDSWHCAAGVYCDVAFADGGTHARLRDAGWLPDHVRPNCEAPFFLRAVLGRA